MLVHVHESVTSSGFEPIISHNLIYETLTVWFILSIFSDKCYESQTAFYYSYKCMFTFLLYASRKLATETFTSSSSI